MHFKYRLIIVFSLSLLLLFCVVCTPPVEANEELIISAASSLTGVMKKIEDAFEKESPSNSIVTNFASSGALLQQIKMGAPVDVYLSASTEFMDRAQKERLIIKETRTDFATGRLVLIVPSDSTLSISDINDVLNRKIRKLAIGNTGTVPAGRYVKTALMHSGLWGKIQDKLIISNSVRQVLDYTGRGEVDAGFVYAADTRSTSKVKTILEINNTGKITYPAAVVSGSKHRRSGIRFIEFLKSDEAHGILAASGFNRVN